MIPLGNPEKIDSRGLISIEDNPMVVFPGYRLRELPSDLADRLVKFVDNGQDPRFVWCLDDVEEEPKQFIARVVKCGIRASDDSGLTWEVLVDDLTGGVLVSGSHFHVWGNS
jgi:hypothetical protein